MQLHHGGADEYTPPEDMAEVQAVAREMGKTLELHVYPGAQHGFAMHTKEAFRQSDADLVQSRAAVFLKRYFA